MIVIILLIIFLLAGWVTLMLPLSDYDSVQLIICGVVGLTVVIIVSASIIIHKLDCLLSKDKEDKSE